MHSDSGYEDSDEAHELWLIQTDGRTLHVGIRVRAWSRRTNRVVERPGAMRPAVGAARVICAGRPRRVLDPCRGTGTILTEAAAAGATTLVGGDVDLFALGATSANTAAPNLNLNLDARRLPFADDSFDAVITNLPFGYEYRVQGSPVAWYRKVLGEATRVAATAVLLVPPTRPFRQALGRTRAELVERHDVKVLGRSAGIWTIRRR